MSESDTDFESASENTRLMDAHVATTSSVGAGDVGNAQNRKRKTRTTNRDSNNHVNYGSVSCRLENNSVIIVTYYI